MTTKCIHFKVAIPVDQKTEIRHALHSGVDSISIRLKPEDQTGGDVISLTQTQVNKLKKAYELNKGATINISKTQIKRNLKIVG